jgi:Lyzozyme M1 (1,4-beta-N-acetylmuramidase)
MILLVFGGFLTLFPLAITLSSENTNFPAADSSAVSEASSPPSEKDTASSPQTVISQQNASASSMPDAKAGLPPPTQQSATSTPPQKTEEETGSAVTEPISKMKANGSISLNLIDIYHKTVINDWNEVKKNVDGIYIKATEGATYTDPSCDAFAKAAIAHGISIGFYHYFWPTQNVQDSIVQAEYFYNTIRKYNYDFFPVLDTEETNGQSTQTIVTDVKAFADTFYHLSKQKVMIYCSPNFIDQHLANTELSAYPLWIASYKVDSPVNTVVWHKYDMWQYNSDKLFPGISGEVDKDVATSNILINKP